MGNRNTHQDLQAYILGRECVAQSPRGRHWMGYARGNFRGIGLFSYFLRDTFHERACRYMGVFLMPGVHAGYSVRLDGTVTLGAWRYRME